MCINIYVYIYIYISLYIDRKPRAVVFGKAA